MNTVFLDTVGLLALWDPSDQWHHAADASFQRLARSRAKTLTSSHVLLECGNAAARRPYRDAVVRLRERLERHRMLISPTEDDWQTAWAQYALGVAGSAGIVDQISFAVMRRLGITRAFTNDQHFRAAGFETLF